MDLTTEKPVRIDDAVLDRIAAINPKLAQKLDNCRKKKKHPTLDAYEKEIDQSESLDCAELFSRYAGAYNLTPETETIRLFLHADFGRFGNCFSTMRDLLTCCVHADVDTLYYDFENQSYHRFFDFPGSSRARRADARAFTPAKNEAVVFVGGKYVVMYGFDTDSDLYPEADKILQKGFTLQSGDPFPLSKMVIHFRSGDIFEGNGAAVGYGQPPLAWYRECVRAHRRHHPDVSVLVICENTNNPCILPFIEWCKSEGIPVEMQSLSLYEDYKTFMRARVIGDSQGTFLKPIYLMNTHLRMIYVRSDFLFRPGAYFAPTEWRNTPAQRELMLSFSEKDMRHGFFYDLYRNAFCRTIYDRDYQDSALRRAGLLMARLVATCFFFSKKMRRDMRTKLYFLVSGYLEQRACLRELKNSKGK